MVKKTVVLLTSLLASALVVGGAFAAYAVTDNANPLGINVTPGELETDQTDYVTLDWGTSTSLSNVSHVQMGKTYRVGVVDLVSSIDYPGVFKLTLSDLTVRPTNDTNKKLIDYMNVYVYDGVVEQGANYEKPDKDAIATITTPKAATDPYLIEQTVNGKAQGTKLSIFVDVDNTAGQYFEAMANDIVHVEVDWNARPGEESTGHVVYFSRQDGWTTDMHAYAWGTGGKNAEWPGVAMQVYNADVYRVSIPNGLETVIFNDGTGTDGGHQTAEQGIAIGTYDPAKPYWNGSAWTAIPAEKSYYVVGKIGGSDTWATPNTYKLSVNPENLSEYVYENLALKKGDEIKIAYFDGTTCGDNDYCWAGENFVAPYDGQFTMYFAKNEDNGKATTKSGDNPVYPLSGFGFAKHLWLVPTPDTVDITLNLGTYADYSENEKAAIFVRYWSNNGVEAFAEIANGKAKVMKDAAGLLVLKNKPGTTDPVWEGDNYIAQSANVVFDATKTTLKYVAAEGQVAEHFELI